MPSLICPICRKNLTRKDRAWACEDQHSFDMAREGYVNLLPAHHRHSRNPGDPPEMIHARRLFLESGAYQPLMEAIAGQIKTIQPHSLLDVGCGEGSYTHSFLPFAREIVGLDISRTAIQLAARRYPVIQWIVGSSSRIPLADASVDCITVIFSQCPALEAARVLQPTGHLLLAVPAPEHLHEIRSRLYEDVRPYNPEKIPTLFLPRFQIARQAEIRFPLHLDRDKLHALLTMTPYAWKAKPARRSTVNALDELDVTAAFMVFLLKHAPLPEAAPAPSIESSADHSA